MALVVTLTFAPMGAAHGELLRSVDGLARGLREATTYTVAVEGLPGCRLLIDDVELRADAQGNFKWAADFHAGQVGATVVACTGHEFDFRLDIGPAPDKLGTEQFEAMLDDIRAFDAKLLLGSSAAALAFGRDGQGARLEPLVRLARLRRYGPVFLGAVRDITARPHQCLRPVTQALPLRHARRIPPTALLDWRLASLADTQDTATALESLPLRSSVPALTMDTPANQALKALLLRFRVSVSSLAQRLEAGVLPGHPQDQQLRQARRLEVLRRLSSETDRMLRMEPFSGITRATVTAAGLTQIAAHPLYARAYRLGMDALRIGIEGMVPTELLLAGPSWGVYESWCFVAAAQALKQLLGPGSLKATACSTQANVDLALSAQLRDGCHVELLFQAVFPAEAPAVGRQAWSLSRERRPDIVITLTQGSTTRFLVLDAKYRSGRTNVLDAMTSAHVYQDSLRLGNSRPELSLLLLPGTADVASLEQAVFWQKHRVGALSGFAAGRAGTQTLTDFLAQWLSRI